MSVAEAIFTITYFLITQKINKVILLGLLIYAAVMIIGYISYQVRKYKRHKKDLLNDLP